MAKISFKPKQVVKKITSHLGDRARDIVLHRFGLTPDVRKKTLEEIGKRYKITRERVRQIEAAAISMIKKSAAYKEEQKVFEELRELIHSLGAVVSEHELLSHITKDKHTQNHVRFFLELSDLFRKHQEDEHFKARWSVDDETAERVHAALRKLYAGLRDHELLVETELIKKFFDHMKDVAERYKNEEIVRRWLSMSKTITKNPLGEWGKAGSPGVLMRGVRDYAYLVMRRHGSPMHFREVADAIFKTFGKKAHYATCHNELIKDPRFVLVGRGLYALAEWGYRAGTAREVIHHILEKEGPLSREEILERVMKERYFKKNTILVNLADSKSFRRNKEGLYDIVKS